MIEKKEEEGVKENEWNNDLHMSEEEERKNKDERTRGRRRRYLHIFSPFLRLLLQLSDLVLIKNNPF